MEEAMIAAGPLEASVRALTPTKGLTFRKGKREANVHEVNDGIVFYGVYLDGDDWPAGLYQATLDEWNRLATQAVENGAEVFTMVRPNVNVRGPEAALSPEAPSRLPGSTPGDNEERTGNA